MGAPKLLLALGAILSSLCLCKVVKLIDFKSCTVSTIAFEPYRKVKRILIEGRKIRKYTIQFIFLDVRERLT